MDVSSPRKFDSHGPNEEWKELAMEFDCDESNYSAFLTRNGNGSTWNAATAFNDGHAAMALVAWCHEFSQSSRKLSPTVNQVIICMSSFQLHEEGIEVLDMVTTQEHMCCRKLFGKLGNDMQFCHPEMQKPLEQFLLHGLKRMRADIWSSTCLNSSLWKMAVSNDDIQHFQLIGFSCVNYHPPFASNQSDKWLLIEDLFHASQHLSERRALDETECGLFICQKLSPVPILIKATAASSTPALGQATAASSLVSLSHQVMSPAGKQGERLAASPPKSGKSDHDRMGQAPEDNDDPVAEGCASVPHEMEDHLMDKLAPDNPIGIGIQGGLQQTNQKLIWKRKDIPNYPVRNSRKVVPRADVPLTLQSKHVQSTLTSSPIPETSLLENYDSTTELISDERKESEEKVVGNTEDLRPPPNKRQRQVDILESPQMRLQHGPPLPQDADQIEKIMCVRKKGKRPAQWYGLVKGNEYYSKTDFCFIKENFDEKYWRSVRAQPNMKLTVPIGSAVGMEGDEGKTSDILPCHSGPLVWRRQLPDEGSCLLASFSSALWHIGQKTPANNIHGAIPKSVNNPNSWNWMLKVGNRFVEKLSKIHHFDEGCLNLLTNRSLDPTVCQLCAKDGNVQHAITTVGDWIFDSNLPQALSLTRESLDWCCEKGGGFHNVNQAARFILGQNPRRSQAQKWRSQAQK